MTDKSISLQELVKITEKDAIATRVALYRHAEIERSHVVTPHGRELRISVASLLEHGWIKPEQLAFLKREHQGATTVNEGRALVISSIVRKQYENLTKSETELLSSLCPEWPVMRNGQILRALMHATGKSRSWLRRDHTTDLRKQKEDALSKLEPEAREEVIASYLQHRTRKAFVQSCLDNQILPQLSPRTWYRIATQLERDCRDELVLVRSGPVALRQQSEPIRRDKTYLSVLEVVVGDYWRVDRIVKWLDGELARPALSLWVDFRSNLIVGAALAKNPNSLGVKMSLMDVFLNFGIPQYAYIDNGKEYKAHRVSGTMIEEVNVRSGWMDEIDSDVKKFEYKGILPSLGIRDINAIARNPRAKVIERVFGRGGFTDWAKEFGDWIGARYWEMPEVAKKAIARYRSRKEYVDRATGETFRFCDLYELSAGIRAFIEYHNSRKSQGFGMDGKSPIEVYTELSRSHPARRANVYELAFAFMEGTVKKIYMNGQIQFKRDMFYRGDNLWAHRGEQVHIRFNPVDGFWWSRADGAQHEFLPKKLLVFDMEGAYIGEAEMVERVHPTQADVKTLLEKTQRTVKVAKESIKGLLVSDVKTMPQEVVKEIEEKKQNEEEECRQRAIRKFPTII